MHPKTNYKENSATPRLRVRILTSVSSVVKNF